MVSDDGKRQLQQTFTQAYFSHSAIGDSDIVLVSDGGAADLKDSSVATPLRQMVHIRVMWSAPWGAKADHPASTNAAIKWRLVGGQGNDSQVEYSGSGFVLVDDTDDGADVTVRTGWMKLASQHGNMTDPIGPSTLRGAIHAMRNPQKVSDLLAQMKGIAPPVAQNVLPIDTNVRRMSLNP